MKLLSRAGLPAGLSLILVLLAGAAAPQSQPASKAQAPSAHPNLVLITVEGLRPDRLSCYRAPGATATPNIDSLAAEGRLFQQVLTSSVSSMPAIATVMTGRTPFQHHVWDDHYWNRLSPDVLTLAERLKKEVYKTAAFVATSRLAAERGLDQGFDLYQDGYRPPANGVWKLAQGQGSRVVPRVKSWLSGDFDGPFFLWVHFVDPAVPVPTTQTRSAADADATGYVQRVVQLDAQLGEILGVLKDRGLAPNTVVVLTSDHGLGIDQHGESRAGVFLYDTTVRVPLLIKTLPGDAKKGSRSADLAGLVDLFPTLERLLNLAPTPGLPGRDLLAPPPSRPSSYYSVALLGREIFGWRAQELVARGTSRLITGAGTELYDVASDPREEKDISASAPAEVSALREEGKRLAGESSLPAAHFLPEKGLPPELSKRLVGLGYAPATPETARARALPDPHGFLSSMRILEFAHMMVEVHGFPAVAELKERLLKEDPEVLFSLINIGCLDAAKAQKNSEALTAAEAFLKKAQRIYPLEGEVYHSLGHIAFQREKYSDAELFIEAAKDLSPRFPAEISYDLACAYAQLGKKEAAISELQRAVRAGFRDAAHISSDSDLDSLRQDAAYKRLIQEELTPAPAK